MVAGHLREKRGYYHIVLSYTDENGNRQTPSKTTGLPVKGNKKRAEAMLIQARREKEAELQLLAATKGRRKSGAPVNITFKKFMLDWLDMMRSSVEETTHAVYSLTIRSKIVPYFDERYPEIKLREITPKHIQDYYTYEMRVNKLSANTVIHRHANIRKALQYAMKIGLIDSNPADLVERPKKGKYVGGYYNESELEQLFEAVKGDPLELAVIVAAFYGLRRSEVIGLKWDAIDFENKTVSIRHTVTQACVDGKSTVVQKDRTKTKSSYRTLPLVPPFERLLIQLKADQARNRKLCGKSYNTDYLDYIYVNEIGDLIKPGYLTQHFPALLEKKLEKNPFPRSSPQLCQLALCQWRQHEGNSGMARPQRYLYHHEYLHLSGCGFQDCFGQCNPEYFPCRVKMSLPINPEMEGHSDKNAAKANNSRKIVAEKIKKEPANMRKSHICEFKSWCR